MICFRDITFCASLNCKCGRQITPEILAAAEKWWNPKDEPEKRDKAPIAYSYFCGGEDRVGWPNPNNKPASTQEKDHG